MTEINVLLDTNIFFKYKYGFCNGSLMNLKKLCNDGTITMYTNDIILREVRHHIKSDVGLLAAQAKNKLEKHIKDHKELENAIAPGVLEEIKKALLCSPENLLAMFEDYMQGAVLLPNDSLSITDLFNDYFEFNAPFEDSKEKKAEFPDAAIIMTIKKHIDLMRGEALHVVTDDDGWHNALEDTVGVIMHKDVKPFLTAISKKQEGLFEIISAYVGTQIGFLREQAEAWLLEQNWDFTVDEIDVCVECDEVDDCDVISINLIFEMTFWF